MVPQALVSEADPSPVGELALRTGKPSVYAIETRPEAEDAHRMRAAVVLNRPLAADCVGASSRCEEDHISVDDALCAHL